MSEYTLQLPDTLFQHLEQLAIREGVPLNQYLIYALTRQVASAYMLQTATPSEIAAQQEAFTEWQQTRTNPSNEQMDALLTQRETVAPEPDLRPEVVEKLRQLLANPVNTLA